ncbi:hypothetical protein [Cryptosporangium aurantiacum]|uniref:hypothetical protein n=1 Tax=Cryptosporangium aurantiacum TaxID=134849 RepID=UPI00093548E0|nr:hypothetical protein [Cryptosporangium aurantiacum]
MTRPLPRDSNRRAGGVHPAAPALVLLLSSAAVNVLDHGAPRLAVAVFGILLSAYLFGRAFGPARFFRDR